MFVLHVKRSETGDTKTSFHVKFTFILLLFYLGLYEYNVCFMPLCCYDSFFKAFNHTDHMTHSCSLFIGQSFGDVWQSKPIGLQ